MSNCADFYQLAARYDIPFHHLPLAAEASESIKRAQEECVLDIVKNADIGLIVLARYMQILSSEMCKALQGRAINIHHSFLPSFKGAKPCYQAHERGVKLIDTTAHFVAGNLGDGPIIEQGVERVDHAMNPATLAAMLNAWCWRARSNTLSSIAFC